ncbi:rhodanese-like domain-containing protein [Kangiella sp. HZ709]|uniref:rhodanese-like domain-containing protein n=1 Tax=Kangiella sp. HZ709 TaxID=2666328 RepID=UPI0018A1EDE4|nr:rhodanese-like domain-containing protein [Kangiella sp. HZ709]
MRNLALLLMLVLVSCSKSNFKEESLPKEQKENLNISLPIKIGQKLNINQVNIEFLELAGDSRCPKGMQCSWAGNAQAVFLVTGNDSAQTLTLNTHGGEKYPKSGLANGYQFTLDKIRPYPATNIRIDRTQIKAELLVTTSVSVKKEFSKTEHVIIDVRSKGEYEQGHYPNAKNLDYKTIEETISTLNLEKDSKIYVYCRSGRRSGIAKALLEEKGYTNVINGINQDKMHDTLGTRVKM